VLRLGRNNGEFRTEDVTSGDLVAAITGETRYDTATDDAEDPSHD